MFEFARRVSWNEHFVDSILLLLIAMALLMGAEATPALVATRGDLIAAALTTLQGAFVVEILLRVLAHGPRPQDYFRSFWNGFDCAAVALSLVPAVGALALIARLLRLVRLLRIVSVSGALRHFATGSARGIAALTSAVLMTGLLWYVMALAGFYLFAATGTTHWASLANALRNVGDLLIFRPLPMLFSGASAPSAHTYLAVLYLAELALLIDLVGALLRAPRPQSGRSP